jgi:hypothetical protein
VADLGFDRLSPNGGRRLNLHEGRWLSPNHHIPFALSRGLSLSKAPCRRDSALARLGFDKLSSNGT